MADIGADPDQLEALAQGLSSASGDLRRSVAGIDAKLQRAGWHGRDADRFRTAWRSRHRRDLIGRADAFGSLASEVRRHAGEQRRASASTGPASPVATLPPTPTTSTTYAVDAGGAIRFLRLDGGVHLTIEELGDERRVTLARELDGGAELSASQGWAAAVGSVEVGQGASAGVEGSLLTSMQETWTVDADALSGLLLGLGLDAVVPTVPLGAWNHASGFVNDAGDVLGGLIGLDPPDVPGIDVGAPQPEQTEYLIGLGGAVGAWSTVTALPFSRRVGGAAMSAEGRHEVRVGFADGTDGSSAVLDVRSTGSVGFEADASAIGSTARGADVSSTFRMEVPLAAGGVDPTRPVLITQVTHLPDQPAGEAEIVRIAADPVLAEVLLDPLRTAISMAGTGDVTGAAGAVGDVTRHLAMVAAVDAEREVSLLVTSTDAHLAGDVGVVAVSGSATTAERRP